MDLIVTTNRPFLDCVADRTDGRRKSTDKNRSTFSTNMFSVGSQGNTSSSDLRRNLTRQVIMLIIIKINTLISLQVPTSTNSLVALMNMVENWRAKTDYGPVCVVSPYVL